MELDNSNIKRLLKITIYNAKKNKRKLLMRIMAYLYLFGTFYFMALFYSYEIRDAVKPLGWFFLNMITLCFYLLYIVINHLLLSIVIPHKILLIFDLLTVIMLLSICVSDVLIENHISLLSF